MKASKYSQCSGLEPDIEQSFSDVEHAKARCGTHHVHDAFLTADGNVITSTPMCSDGEHIKVQEMYCDILPGKFRIIDNQPGAGLL